MHCKCIMNKINRENYYIILLCKTYNSYDLLKATRLSISESFYLADYCEKHKELKPSLTDFPTFKNLDWRV